MTNRGPGPGLTLESREEELAFCQKGWGWVRPDFVGLNVSLRKEIWVEHMGMMDMLSYSEENVKKLHDYERNGFVLGDDLLVTMETRRSPLEARSIEEMTRRYFL